MSDVSLYSLTSDFSNLMESIAENGGEIDEEKEAALASAHLALTTKTDNVVAWIHSQEDLIALADNRIKQFQEFKKKILNRLEKFDGYTNACLETLNVMKLEGTLSVIKKRKPTKVVVIHDETLIPMDFIKIPEPVPSIMKKEIGDALKKNIEVPGASLEDSKNISLSYDLK